MRSLRFFHLGLAIFLACPPLPAFAQLSKAARVLQEACSEFSQAGMRDCLAKQADASQMALTQAEELVRQQLTRWDEDAKYIAVAKHQLARSNRDFIRYRATQCELARSLVGGAAGNSREIVRLTCVAELNIKRTEQLRESIAGLLLR